MTQEEKILSRLLTQDEQTDRLIRRAFSEGKAFGQDSERKNVSIPMRTDIVTKTIATLMQTLNMDTESIMSAMKIPLEEQDKYRRIFAARQRQKSEARKK